MGVWGEGGWGDSSEDMYPLGLSERERDRVSGEIATSSSSQPHLFQKKIENLRRNACILSCSAMTLSFGCFMAWKGFRKGGEGQDER